MRRTVASTLAVTSALALAAGCGADRPRKIAAAGSCTVSTPFTSGRDGYHVFRIPAVVRTRGTLVAFAEGRRGSAADSGDVEVVARRSTDGGCSWSPMRRVADNGRDVAGNPAPVVDPATGRIVLLTTRQSGAVTQPQIEAGKVGAAQGRRVYVQSSADAGATWSAPKEITGAAKRPGWRWYATGPGAGTALASGRLVIPANHTAAGSAGAHLLLSDDHGATWRIGAVDDHSDGRLRPDESAAAQLPDGRLYVNARDQYGTDPASRVSTYSLTSGSSFSAPFRPAAGLVAPVVDGALLQDAGTSCRPLLFSAPDDPAARRHLTVRRSLDGGRTWRTATVVTPGPAAYSDLVKIDRTVAGVLYETGSKSADERVEFRRFTVTCP
ncbi:sialidase family protein [Streptomyces sp. B1866]|uniref:sialidase family protein n=1 Tax=Streptomyces sp. B1866 TaxID=3075431 RepID=UPI00288F7D7E|nr:sialidase family protein [Streptomyces sp. B1866]MDT3399664.1 sialidase family protein [Streptomyces sp. B1866]